MVYNPSIPQPTDLISASQAEILANFTAIDTGTTGGGIGFSVNHITMTDPSYPGMHDLIEMPLVQSADPTSTGVNFSSIYSKTGSTNAEPFFLNNASPTGQVMWYGGTGHGGVITTIAQSGSLNLPNGLQFRWGYNTSGSTNVSKTISFSTAFSTACLNVQLTPIANNASGNTVVLTQAPLSAGSFNMYGNASGLAFYYFAIGY